MMVAALYVHPGGVYFGLPDVDPWDVARDARLYTGPHPVVAHPPCERWGRYWSGGPRADQSKPGAQPRKLLGDDGGCFAAAVRDVRKWGGVLEHPEASHAWAHHGLRAPPRVGGWVMADEHGWACCVEQGNYGHPARKATWLYAVGFVPPDLAWGSAGQRVRLYPGFHTAEERAARMADPVYRAMRRKGVVQFQKKSARHLSPLPFRDLLLSLARRVVVQGAARHAS